MAQQVVLGAFWFNPRNLPVKHVTPSKYIVLIIEVSSDIPGQVLKSTTSPAQTYFCGILSKQLETDRLNSHKLAIKVIVRKIRRLDCETQYVVLIRRFDTSYPTGGYGVSVYWRYTPSENVTNCEFLFVAHIIKANVIPPDHVDDLPVVEPNQSDDVPVIPEPVLVDEDEDPKEEEFKEERGPQEEDDMEVDIKEDENEPELTIPYEETDSLNPPPPISESESEDVIEVEDTVKPKDENVPASVYEVGESSTATIPRKDENALVKKKGKAKDKFYSKLIVDLDNEVRSSVEEGAAAMENLVRKLGNAEEKAECEKLKKELEEARIMPPKSPPLTQAVVQRMIKESVDAAIAAERARHANTGNDARGSGPVRGQDTAPVVRECTFAGYMKCNPTVFRGVEGAVELQRWFEKTESVFEIMNVPRARNGKSNQKDKSRQPSQNNQQQGNARAMTTALTDGKVSSGSLPVCECCFTRHVGQCIKYHKCGNIGHKARYCKEKSVATGANAQPIPTCYFYGEQGHTRNQCPKKVKQEETREVCGRTYVIKDAKPQGLNVVSGTFLLNNRYASVLFDLGFDRSFVNTRFSSILEIDPCRIILSQVWDDYLEF
ncbi:hypothetical protein Tco_0566322 [Tanacetum coccineum]